MDRTFSIAPSSAAPLITIAAIGIVLLAILGLLAFIGYSSRNVKFEVSEGGLQIRGSVYGRLIPRQEVIGDGVRIVNLDTSTEYKPRLRTNGTGLPGYSEGWFRLKNGERALLFVTDRSSVVYIPTTQGYSVLLSVREPDKFYEATKRWR